MDTRKYPSDLQLNCFYCQKSFFIRKNEYDRQIRKGRTLFFCSMSCGAYSNNKNRLGQLLSEQIRKCEYCSLDYTPIDYDQRFCSKTCANKFNGAFLNRDGISDEIKLKISKGVKNWIKNNPEKDAEIRSKQQASIAKNGIRYSSKAERQLAEALRSFGFKRHYFVRSGLEINFDVDMCLKNELGMIWVESDGPYHFRKVHKKHDFEKTIKRDQIENEFIKNKNILLIRVNNEKYGIEEQVLFIKKSINEWHGSSSLLKLY